MKIRHLFGVLVVFLVQLSVSPITSATSAQQVLVVYRTNGLDLDNDGVSDSKQLADYYVKKRGIPASNVLGVTISAIYGTYASADYTKFYADLVSPIKARLAKLGPTNIDVILLMGNIPPGIENSSGTENSLDNALMMLSYLDPQKNNIMPIRNPYFEPTSSVGTDLGHFEHRLYKIFNTDMYLVSRIENIEQ